MIARENLTQWIKFFLVGVTEISKAQLKYLKDEASDYCFLLCHGNLVLVGSNGG